MKKYLYNYIENIDSKISMANSMWINNKYK